MRANERATQIWSVLALAAYNHQVLTYDIVSKLIGVPARGLGQLLEPIQSYCLLHRIPPLSILVVSGTTGMPGVGFVAAQDIPREQLRVFSHDWLSESPPTPEQLQDAVQQLPSNGDSSAVKNQIGLAHKGKASKGVAMAQALEEIAGRGSLEDIDAQRWQQETRQERPLPGRAE